ncbi:MAG TPA: YkgJ family cysteine cluster protein [Geobacteraceae bacterium]
MAETPAMHMTAGRGILDNYRELLAKVDLFCRKVEEDFAAHLACRAGCDDCCRHISLFWVEAVALADALGDLPAGEAARIRARAAGVSPDAPCPLLENGRCLLYAARPIICRTHGLPLLTVRNGNRTVDFCPRNFLGIGSLPGSAVIDLDRLNTALAAINTLFVAQLFEDAPPAQERVSIAEALGIEP